jgi:hypothetical protein
MRPHNPFIIAVFYYPWNNMPILSYILVFISLALIAWGFTVRGGGIKAVPGYKPDPNVEVREEELVKFASRNIILIGVVDLIIAMAMILIGGDNYLVFGATILFTLFIIFAIRYASKVMVIPK